MEDVNKLEKKDLPFDSYGRHALIRDIITSDRPQRRVKILDVGGRYNLMEKFLPEDDVYYLDLEVNINDKNAIQGDGRNIPLEDKSFDYVVSADVFEHINPQDRQKFLKECMRVSKVGFVLAAPFYSTDVESAEKDANESFKIISGGKDHKWLLEHIKNGLPREDEVYEFTKNQGLYVRKTFINDIRLWEHLITLGFIGTDKDIFSDDFIKFNEFYNNNVYSFDRSENSYRKVFFIKREDSFQMPHAKGAISDALYLKVITKSDNLMFAAVKRLERKKEELLMEKKEVDKKLKKKEDLKKLLREKDKELDQKQRELDEKVKEIAKLHKSTSWRITRPIRSTKLGAKKVTSLSKKSKRTIQTEGLYKFFYKTGRFLSNRFRAKFSSGGSFSHQSYLDIKLWYEKNKKKVTIIIPSYNDYKLLSKGLISLNKTVDTLYVNIIIIDDASTDENHIKFLKSLKQENLRVIYQKKNGGFAKTVNVGFKKVKSGDVILLNSDIEAKEFWLESLQYAAYSDKKVGIVGPKLLYPNGTIQYAGSHRNLDAPEWFDHYYRFKPSNFAPANIPNYVISITGACMYIKREVINKIGYLDEKFPMAFEDTDYSLRAWNEGYRSLYFPMATLIHHESVTRGTKQGAREKESLRYFWEKWGEWFDDRNVIDNNGKTKIIYVLQSTGVGGGHRIVFEHVNRLKDLGLNIELWALEGQPKWFPLKVNVKTFKNYSQLIKELENKEAIKVATWWETAEPVWLASVNKGIPVFFVQDIESSYYKDDEYMQQFVLSKYRKEFKYFTTSGVNEKALLDMGLKPTVIPCGIDVEIFKSTQDKREENVMLSLGRSHYLKNLIMTMDAWRSIKNNQPTLWMFGIEPQLADGVKNTKYFLKPTDKGVNNLYNKATVFVQTSRHEGFCLPILEAMAAGAPVICTDAHGNADFCIDGKNCLMVDHDDVKILREKIEKLFSDRSLQSQLRKEGYKTAHEYSWPVVMKKLAGFFQKTANKK